MPNFHVVVVFWVYFIWFLFWDVFINISIIPQYVIYPENAPSARKINIYLIILTWLVLNMSIRHSSFFFNFADVFPGVLPNHESHVLKFPSTIVVHLCYKVLVFGWGLCWQGMAPVALWPADLKVAGHCRVIHKESVEVSGDSQLHFMVLTSMWIFSHGSYALLFK